MLLIACPPLLFLLPTPLFFLPFLHWPSLYPSVPTSSVCFFSFMMFLNLLAAITIVPAFRRRLRALNFLRFSVKPGNSSRGVSSPLIQGCARIPSASSLSFGSTTRSCLIRPFAKSDTSSQYGEGKSKEPFFISSNNC